MASLEEMELDKPVEESSPPPAGQDEADTEPPAATPEDLQSTMVEPPLSERSEEEQPGDQEAAQAPEDLLATIAEPPLSERDQEEQSHEEEPAQAPEDLEATLAEPPLSERGEADPLEKYVDTEAQPESLPDLSLERTQEVDLESQDAEEDAIAEPSPEQPEPPGPPSYGPSPTVSYDDDLGPGPKKSKSKLFVIVGVVAVVIIILAVALSGGEDEEQPVDEPGKMEPIKPPEPATPETPGEPGVETPGEAPSPDGGALAPTPGETPPAEPPPETQPEVPPEPEPAPDLEPIPEPETKPLPKIVYGARGKGKGKIRVTSRPSRAPIYLDGVFTGKLTPYTFKRVPAGIEHTVMVEKKRRRAAFVRFKLKRNKTRRVKLFPKKGKRRQGQTPVHIVSRPKGAWIFLDGKNTRKKTPAEIDLGLGAATKLELRRRGYRRWKRIVRPIPKVDLSVNARLRKKR